MDAYFYLRMSSEEQEKGDSRRRQTDICKAYAEANGLNLITTFEGKPFEDIGLSAYTGEHIATGRLGRFLKAATEGRLPKDPILLIEALDRFDRRDVYTAQITLLTTLKAGVTVITAADGRKYTPTPDMFQVMGATMISGQSNYEIKKRTERLVQTNNEKRKNTANRKLSAQCVAWCEPDKMDDSGKRPLPKTYKFRAEPIHHKNGVGFTRKDVVLYIFQLAKTNGQRRIADILNEEGFPPFGLSRGVTDKATGKVIKKNNHKWTPSSVSKILTNVAVLGWKEFMHVVDGKTVPFDPPEYDKNYYPPLVSNTLWKQVRIAREKDKTYSAELGHKIGVGGNPGQNVTNLFTNIAVCWHCGLSMQIAHKNKSKKSSPSGKYEYSRLHCYAGKACSFWKPKYWPYDHFEKSVLKEIEFFDLDRIMKGEVSTIESRKLEQEIDKLEDDLDQEIELREREYQLWQKTNDEFIEAKLAGRKKNIEGLRFQIKSKKDLLKPLTKKVEATKEAKEQLQENIQLLQDKTKPDNRDLRALVKRQLAELITKIEVAPIGIWEPLEEGEIPDESEMTQPMYRITYIDGTTHFVVPDMDDPFAPAGGDMTFADTSYLDLDPPGHGRDKNELAAH